MGTSDCDLAEPTPGFDSIHAALGAVAAGELVVVLDDEDRENEGDLIAAADKITPAAMAFIVNHTSGVVCVGMEGADLDRLRIPLMVSSTENEEAMCTAFTVTVDLRHGTSTGISAADRAATLRALADPDVRPEDFKRPGHIFPLRARAGGVLRRPGHTEASVDLCRLAKCQPAGVLCEIVNPDGTMARTPQLLQFAKTHGLKCITIADLVRYRLKYDPLVECTAVAPLPTRYGEFTAHAYRSLLDGTEHIALVMGRVRHADSVLTRVHSESMLSDLFGAARCDSGSQLDAALAGIGARGSGVLVYLRGQQGRGLPLAEELQAHATAEAEANDTTAFSPPRAPQVDARDYSVAAHILRDLGVSSVVLVAANPATVNCLKAHGMKVATEQLSTLPAPQLYGAAPGPLAAAATAATPESSKKGPRSSRNGAEPHFV
ncbi:hypothetical protein CHLNCDRAFT_24136 [Chlorella variabilis]|uniref:3,4-dihydroxy-2-butanone-4-phosphate synthase n=1 Tax=Chlorella variabilis TaxID=554065 RepID=E1ZGD3_CHLVA|nr:hypothetical protein CHLNCDRAFT_24136 [Chlorella variabilis]EFN54915.1 hypothetical protein CHLNCDRAFT_24136 [Chlorella variabilis]|eukprot:XP_005847017.1 hypothetical protein CHLNCDRAFT_24136 [Chlorella variabilis]